MGRRRERAQVCSVAGAAISLIAYMLDARLAGLAGFATCCTIFGLLLVSRAGLARAQESLLAGASSLCQVMIGAIKKAAALVPAPRRSRARTPTFRIKKPHTESRVAAVMGPHIRRVLDAVTDTGTLRRVYGELNPNMVKSVALAGLAIDLKKLRREAGMALIISGLATVILAVILAYVTEHAGPVAAAFALPVIVLFYPRIKLMVAASERKHALGDEMTFFAVYCLLLAEVGKTVVHALASVSGRGVFPALEREAAVMERGRGLGMGKMVALGDLGRNHPNRDFGDLLGGYVAAFNAGDPKAHLRAQAEKLLKKMQKRLEAYREHSTSLCVMVTFMMFFLPVMVAPIAMIAGAGSALFLSQVSLLVMPVMTVMVCVIAHTVQPKFGDAARFGWRVPLCIAAGAGVLAWVLEPEKTWLIMGAAAVAFAACGVAATWRRRRIASAIDGNQAQFFRDITSHISSGDSSVSHAMNRAAGSGQYDGIFASIISRANFRIRYAGELIQDVLADTAKESWLGRFSFFLLSRIADTGSVDAWVLTRTTEFVERFVSLKRDITSAIRLYMVVAAVSPVGVVAMTWFLKSILVGFPASIGSIQPDDFGIGMSNAGTASGFDEAVNVLTMASAICANVAVAKIASMSMTDMRPLLAGTLVALVCILAVPHFPVH